MIWKDGPMREIFICEGVRTPIGKYGGSLATLRTDDLAALPMVELIKRLPAVNWESLDEVILGCANQAGEDNRNVARMSLLLAGLPETIPGVTVNRLCASGLDAVIAAARMIRCGEAELVMAGGVENMSRAPFVMGKSEAPFSRKAEIFDTTIGWRFVNPRMASQFGVDSMPETAENLVDEFGLSRQDQDAFARWSQEKVAAAAENAKLDDELIEVTIPRRKSEPLAFHRDEHPRLSTLEQLAALKTPFRDSGTITAGNASGVNDGAAAMIIASETAVKRFGLQPMARIMGAAAAGVSPRVMGVGPVSASNKLLNRLNLNWEQLDLIEINEAFAAQVLACTRQWGLADNDDRINPLGGAIALGHPLGMSGARLALTAAHQIRRGEATRALCTMCVGVGQGVAMVLAAC